MPTEPNQQCTARSNPGFFHLEEKTMAYTNSPLVAYTKLSPNHSGQRTHSIDRITPHCVVGQLSAESICGCFINTSRQASCNYGIGKDGRVSLCVEEKNRSWCSSSRENDQRAITIECASDNFHPYAMNDAVYTSLIKLCTDICKRNGKTKLIWLADKNKTLNYTPAADEMVLSVHRWFAAKACPGDWLYARLGDLAAKVTAALGTPAAPVTTGLQATALKTLTDAEVVAKVAPLFTANQKQSGILASVSLAQFILESGYGKSELAQNATNCFGMKKSLSGNSWAGSAWDGQSVYTKQTGEQNPDGSYETITADFRKYASVEDSITDHSAYLLGAMNGDKKRYEGLAGCKDYKKAVQLIKDGGYATSLTYVQNLCSVIERWNLTQYDVTEAAASTSLYRVRKSWSDAASQKGAFRGLSNAKACADKNPGYSVFDGSGNMVYAAANIRKGPGTNYGSRGYTGKGVFTIVEESTGKGATKWGLLKSYASKKDGWVSLDYAKKV